MAIPEFDLNHSDLRARGTHPCKGRKDGAPSIVVIPAKPKGGPPANGITEMGDCGRGNGMSGWLRSSIAGKLFLYSSWAVVSMGIFMLFMLTPWFQQMQAVPWAKFTLQVVGGTLGVVGAPASVVIWFGMVIYCLSEDHVSSKFFWFILFFGTAWFGAAIYFFTVYRKQVRMMNLSET